MPRSFRTLLAAAAAATAAHCLLGVRLDGLALSVAARRLGGTRVSGGPHRILEEVELPEESQHDDVAFTGLVTDDVLGSPSDMPQSPTVEDEQHQDAAYTTDAAVRGTEAIRVDDAEEEETVDALLHPEASDKQVQGKATFQGVTPKDAAPHRETQEETDVVDKQTPQHVEELPTQATALNSATAAIATDGVADSQLTEGEGASQRLLAEANLGDNIAQALGTASGRLAGGLSYLLSAFQPLSTEEHEEDSANKAWVGKPVLLRPVLDAAEVARRLGVNEGVARDLVRAVRQLFPIPLPTLPGGELHRQTVETAPKLRSVNSETSSADAAVVAAEAKQRRLQLKYASENVDELFEVENIRLIGERLIDLIKPLFVVPRGVGGYIIGDHKDDAYTATGGATLWTKPLFERNIFKPSSSTAEPAESSSTTASPDDSSSSTSSPGSSTSSTAAPGGSSSSTSATSGSSSSTPATSGSSSSTPATSASSSSTAATGGASSSAPGTP